MCAGFDDLDRFTARLGKLNEEEGWTIDAYVSRPLRAH